METGAFGEVHKGLLTEIPNVPGYLVAIKIMHPSPDLDRAAALQEAAFMAQFKCEVSFSKLSQSIIFDIS